MVVFLVSCGKNSENDGGNSDNTLTEETDGGFEFFSGSESLADGNFLNYGYAAYDNGYIYYRSNDKGSIYRCMADGTNPVKLNDCESTYINVYKGYIYYINNDDNYQIYKMSVDGSENNKLLAGASDHLTIYKDRLYYINNYSKNKIYSVGLDGKGETQVSLVPCAYSFSIMNDVVFYLNQSDNNRVYSIKTDCTQSRKINDASAGFVYAAGDNVFFSSIEDSKCIYKADALGDDAVKIVDDTAEIMNVSDGYIYYTKGKRLFRANGKGESVLICENCASPNFAGKYIFFYADGKMCRMLKDGSNLQVL